MRFHIRALALLTATAALAHAAETNTLPITHVTVFAGQAEVTRGGPVYLAAGATAIVLTGLPWDLDENSLLAGASVPNVRVRRMEIEPVYDRLIRDEQAATLRQQVDELTARIDDLTAQAERLRRQVELAGAFSIQAPAGAPNAAPPVPPLAPRDWMQVLDFAGEAVGNAAADRLAIQGRIAEETLKLEVLSTQLERLASKDSRRYRNVTLVVESPEAVDATLAVSYLVAGPEWFPRYEVRAAVDDGRVRIRAYGLVRQQTGEDWLGARLTLATVDLAQSATPPRLTTVRYMPGGMLASAPDKIVHLGRDADDSCQLTVAGSIAAEAATPAPARDALSISGPALTDQRQQVATMQSSLLSARSKLRGALDRESVAAGKPARETAETDREIQDGDGDALNPQQARFGQLRKLYRMQRDALQTGDFGNFAMYNGDINALFDTLPGEQQKALVSLRQETGGNVEKAQRLIQSRATAKSLTAPAAAANGVDYRFDCLGAVSVHSEGVLTKVPYLDTEVAVETIHEAAPGEREDFYLVAEGRNPLGQPLLPGPMAVFIGPDFVGESRLDFRAGGASLRFELGIDRDVTITRRFERLRETTGMILAVHDYRYNVTIHAVNRKDRPIRVRVFDRYPHAPKHADVDVEGFVATPPPNSTTTQHLLRWDANLPPGAAMPIAFEYHLKHRRNTTLVTSEGGRSW